MFVVIHNEEVYGPFETAYSAKEYATDRFGGSGTVRPLNDVPTTMGLSVEDAIKRVNAIAARCEDISVKILTVQDVLIYADQHSSAPSMTAEHIRATDGWGVWCELNDWDFEEVASIAHAAEKDAVAEAAENE